MPVIPRKLSTRCRRVGGEVGVFVGVMYGGFINGWRSKSGPVAGPIWRNSAYWSVANRLSFVFDFQGPQPGGRYGLLLIVDGDSSGVRELAPR